MTTSAEDVVAVFNMKSGAQVFASASAMRLQVSPTSKTMAHPLETGVSVVDHRVILPLEGLLLVTITGADTVADAYGEIRDLFLKGTMLTLQCKAASFSNLYISGMPHEETGDKFNAIDVAVRLVEAQFFKSRATAAVPAPRNSKSSSTAKRGEQAPRQSVAHQIFG